MRKALEDYPAYGLVLTGHSLGGGAAALLSILWSCPSTFYDAHVASLPGAAATVGQRTPFVTNFSSGLPSGRECLSSLLGQGGWALTSVSFRALCRPDPLLHLRLVSSSARRSLRSQRR